METPYVEEPGTIAENIDWWDLEYVALDEQLVCPICRTAFVEPYTTDCGHTFCRNCIKECWNPRNGQRGLCPIDRIKLKTDPQPAPFVVRSLLDDLEVYCPYKEAGCGFSGKRWLLESHVQLDCRFVSVYCHHPCTNHILRSEFSAAGCKCQETPQETPQPGDARRVSSSSISTQTSEPSHVEETQEEVEHEGVANDSDLQISVKCPGHVFGCTECGETLEAMAGHIDACVLAKINGAFDAQAKRTTAIETENRCLKRQVDVFQSLIRKNTTELDSHILGEYERILKDLRESRSALATQQAAITNLLADNSRITAELSYIQGNMDSMRRQLHILSQSQRRLSFFSAFQSTASHPHNEAPEPFAEDPSKKRGQQKL